LTALHTRNAVTEGTHFTRPSPICMVVGVGYILIKHDHLITYFSGVLTMWSFWITSLRINQWNMAQRRVSCVWTLHCDVTLMTRHLSLPQAANMATMRATSVGWWRHDTARAPTRAHVAAPRATSSLSPPCCSERWPCDIRVHP